jgi:cystathionine beta-lyase family protein involved in aluminum resistance
VIDALLERFAFAPDVVAAARSAAAHARDGAAGTANARVRATVLAAFDAEGVAESDLWGTLGYGYDDAARARYESLVARVLGAERALARLSLVSGTHAIVVALGACVPPGTRLVVATGRPYDTLRSALVDAPFALTQRGVAVDEVALAPDGGPDYDAIAAECAAGCAAVFVQRSRGYGPRRSLSAAECGAIARAVKRVAPQVPVLVDNCYGELVEEREPTAFGADLVIGSLIKNLGGGIAPGGAYVAGSAELVERIAAFHYAPGLGSAVGPTLGFGRSFMQGLFLAPLVVGEALAGLDFLAALFAELGYRVDPAPGAPRYDIVQAVRLGDPQRLLTFARGLQTAMPVNARFSPEPGPVPGYREPVVMSAGAFVAGATIELSCDAPLRAPFEVYVQGGTLREHVALGALRAADALATEGLLRPQRGVASEGVVDRKA